MAQQPPFKAHVYIRYGYMEPMEVIVYRFAGTSEGTVGKGTVGWPHDTHGSVVRLQIQHVMHAALVTQGSLSCVDRVSSALWPSRAPVCAGWERKICSGKSDT